MALVARRIVFARKSGFHADGEFERAMFVDRWIEIDWKHKVFVDAWSGDITDNPPTFRIGLASRTYEGGLPTLIEYGTISRESDVEWVKGATHGSYWAGKNFVAEVKNVVVRVHQINVVQDGQKGFEVEILTGDDATTMINRATVKQVVSTAREFWWLFPLICGILWFVL